MRPNELIDLLELDAENHTILGKGEPYQLTEQERRWFWPALEAQGRMVERADKNTADFRSAQFRLNNVLRSSFGLEISAERNKGIRLRVYEPEPAEVVVANIGLWNSESECGKLHNSVSEAFENTLIQLSGGNTKITVKFHKHSSRAWTVQAITEALEFFDREGVAAIVGLDSPGALLLLESRQLDKFKIPVLSPIASSGALCFKDIKHPLFFRCRSSDRSLIQEMCDWIADEHRGKAILPLVQTADCGPKSYGQQNFEVFLQLSKELVVLPEFTYPQTQDAERTNAWIEHVANTRPDVIAIFGLDSILAPLCRLAVDLQPELSIYEINPRVECFIDPTASGTWNVAREPIEQLRAVVGATYPLGPGDPTAVVNFRRKWMKQHPTAAWTYRSALLGHDTACILYAAIKATLEKGFTKLRDLRGQIPSMLEGRAIKPGALLSEGIFTDAQELTVRSRRRVRLRGHSLEGYISGPDDVLGFAGNGKVSDSWRGGR